MLKTAQIKEAETRAVLAALVDNGYMSVDGPETFDKIACEVLDVLPDQYDVNLIKEAAEAVVTGEFEKDASETAAQMALGELAMMKIAGEIDDEQFDAIAQGVIKEAEEAKKESLLTKAKAKAKAGAEWVGKHTPDKLKYVVNRGAAHAAEGARGYLRAMKGTPVRAAWNTMKNGGISAKDAAKAIGKTTGAWGGTIAGLYGAKKLYDKYSK